MENNRAGYSEPEPALFREGYYFAARDSMFSLITYPDSPMLVHFPNLQDAFAWSLACQQTVQVLKVSRLGLFQAQFGSSFPVEGWSQGVDGLYRPVEEVIHT